MARVPARPLVGRWRALEPTAVTGLRIAIVSTFLLIAWDGRTIIEPIQVGSQEGVAWSVINGGTGHVMASHGWIGVSMGSLAGTALEGMSIHFSPQRPIQTPLQPSSAGFTTVRGAFGSPEKRINSKARRVLPIQRGMLITCASWGGQGGSVIGDIEPGVVKRELGRVAANRPSSDWREAPVAGE